MLVVQCNGVWYMNVNHSELADAGLDLALSGGPLQLPQLFAHCLDATVKFFYSPGPK